MSIRIKVSLITSFVFLVIIATIYFLVSGLINNNFTQLERNEVSVNFDRITNAIQTSVDNLNIKSSDWANWDDTYTFMKTKNREFVQANISPKAVTDLDLSFMAFIDQNKHLLVSQNSDPVNQELTKINTGLITYILALPEFSSLTEPNSSLSGIAGLDLEPVIFSVRPVATSEGKGPTDGWIVFARILDTDFIKKISNSTRLSFSLTPGTGDFSKNKFTYASVTPTTLIAETGLHDIDRDTHYLIKLTLPRTIYQEGHKSLDVLTNSLIFFGAFSTIIFNILLYLSVVYPITRLSEEFSAIIKSGDLAKTVNSRQQDEIGNLGLLINKLLQQVVLSNTELVIERDKAKSIIFSMGEGLLLIDINHRISTINPAAEKLLETTQAEAQGLSWSDLISASKNDSIIPLEDRAFTKVFTTGKTVITTIDDNHYYTTRSGKKFPVVSITTPLFDRNNSVVGAVKLFRDVTHEKTEMTVIEEKVTTRTAELAEKNTALQKAKYEIALNWSQLQKEKARLTTSLNSLPIGFILIDVNSLDIILINQTAKSILGLRSETITLLSQITARIAGVYDLTANISTCIAEKHTLDVPEIVYGKKIIRLFIAPIYMDTSSSEQSYIGTAVLLSDITDEKNLARSRDEFFSIASHELRTPLTAIRGNSSLIMDNFMDQIQDADLKEMISDIHASSVSLIDIVNEFLNLSRLEMGRIEFKKEQFDLVQLLNEVVTELSSQASAAGLTLGIDPTSVKTYLINSDRNRVKEIVVNLVGNSIKYTESGSVTVKVNAANNKVMVEVADTGRGIPESQQNLLFKKFQQAGESLFTRDTSKSTGLGLYISKLITEGLGGTIGLSWSEPGKGSSFFFTLPS